MLHDHAPTPLSTSNPYITTAMDELSSYERISLILLISLSLAMVVLLVGEARLSITGLKGKSGRHPMLSVLPIEELAQTVAEYKAEPTPMGRVMIVATYARIVTPVVYLGISGLCIAAYVLQFFVKDPQTVLGAQLENGDLQ